MRSSSGALVGDGGGTGGLVGVAASVAAITWNATDTTGAVANALPTVRSTPEPASNATGPATQQLSQLLTRRASDGASCDALARLAVGWVGAAMA